MIGTRVGQWKITQEIGDGGHAFVFKGETDTADNVVAIKMLKPSVAGEENLEKRFEIEAEALKELDHPQIVGFKDYIFRNGYHYLVMEFMNQGSVENLIQTMSKIAPRYAVPILFGVLEGIRYSHDKGFIHRDLKPSNILINEEGEAKLTDFGIAKVVGGQNLTKKGMVLGTTLYMAPEFISRGTVSVKTDIYALGVTFFEMLTGRRPFEYDDDEPLASFARRVCTGQCSPPSTYTSEVSPELDQIVMTAVAQNPKVRYQNAQEIARDLERFFPDLVRRPIIVPSGRAMTGEQQVAPVVPEVTERSAAEGVEPISEEATRDGRGVAGVFVVIGIMILVAKSLVPSVDGGAAIAMWIGGGVVLLAGLGLMLSGRSRPATRPRPRATIRRPSPKKPVSSTSDDPLLTDSDLEGFESSVTDDSDAGKVAALADDDTIPFHDPVGGSRVSAPSDVSELNAYLVVTEGEDEGRRFALRPVSRIGRDLRLDIRPKDPEISRHHAIVTFDGTNGFVLEDLGSLNGTYVNDERLSNARRGLVAGDIVRIGRTAMRLECVDKT